MIVLFDKQLPVPWCMLWLCPKKKDFLKVILRFGECHLEILLFRVLFIVLTQQQEFTQSYIHRLFLAPIIQFHILRIKLLCSTISSDTKKSLNQYSTLSFFNIYVFERERYRKRQRERKRERERDLLPSAGSFPKCSHLPGLDQARSGIRSLFQVFYIDGTDPHPINFQSKNSQLDEK